MHWFEGWQLVCRICRPRRWLFYGNNFLKILSFYTSVEYIKHSIAYLWPKALCTAQDVLTLGLPGTFAPSIQTTMDSPSWLVNAYFNRHGTFRGLWLKVDYYVHNGRILPFILSWSTLPGYSDSILSLLAKKWLAYNVILWQLALDLSWYPVTSDHNSMNNLSISESEPESLFANMKKENTHAHVYT